MFLGLGLILLHPSFSQASGETFCARIDPSVPEKIAQQIYSQNHRYDALIVYPECDSNIWIRMLPNSNQVLKITGLDSLNRETRMRHKWIRNVDFDNPDEDHYVQLAFPVEEDKKIIFDHLCDRFLGQPYIYKSNSALYDLFAYQVRNFMDTSDTTQHHQDIFYPDILYDHDGNRIISVNPMDSTRVFKESRYEGDGIFSIFTYLSDEERKAFHGSTRSIMKIAPNALVIKSFECKSAPQP